MSEALDEAQMELLRDAILRVLDAASALRGLAPEAVAVHVRRFGFEVGPAAMARELQYLADKGFVAPVKPELNPKNVAWRITAAGRDIL